MKNVKAIIFDADGMVVRRVMYFSERFSRDFNVPIKKIMPFFKNEFQLCIIGKADLKEELVKYLPVWNWTKSINELLKFWFENEKDVDQKIIDDIQDFRKKRIKCYLSTNNEKYRVDFLSNNLGLGNYFDDFFTSSHFGCKKSDEKFWQLVYDKIKVENKNEVLVWDDDKKNLSAAKSFGFRTEFYKGFEEFREHINDLQK